MLPLGAATPDDLLAAALDPALGDDDRQAVEAWLAANPQWRARAGAYEAMRSAAALPAASADQPPPDVAGLVDLWAAIDADQRMPAGSVRPPPPFSPAPPSSAAQTPPPPPTEIAAARSRRRGVSPWLAVAAGLLGVVAGLGTVLALAGGTDEQDTAGRSVDVAAASSPPVVAPGGSVGADDGVSVGTEEPPGDASPAPSALALLRNSAEATTAAGTAHVEYRMLATSDVSGGEIGEVTGEDTVAFESVGLGQIEFPGRSILTTSTTTRVGERTDFLPAEHSVIVRDAGRSFYRCDGDPDYVEAASEDDIECFASGVSPDWFGPFTSIETIGQSSFASSGITELGTDTMADGTVITGYQVIEPVTVDIGETLDVTFQYWVDGDDFIRRVVTGADFSAGATGYPTTLVMAYDLVRLGEPVDIPELD